MVTAAKSSEGVVDSSSPSSRSSRPRRGEGSFCRHHAAGWNRAMTSAVGRLLLLYSRLRQNSGRGYPTSLITARWEQTAPFLNSCCIRQCSCLPNCRHYKLSSRGEFRRVRGTLLHHIAPRESRNQILCGVDPSGSLEFRHPGSTWYICRGEQSQISRTWTTGATINSPSPTAIGASGAAIDTSDPKWVCKGGRTSSTLTRPLGNGIKHDLRRTSGKEGVRYRGMPCVLVLFAMLFGYRRVRLGHR